MSSLTVAGSAGLGLVMGWSASLVMRGLLGPRQRAGLLVVVLAAAAESYAFSGAAGLLSLFAAAAVAGSVHRSWMRRLALAARSSDGQRRN